MRIDQPAPDGADAHRGGPADRGDHAGRRPDTAVPGQPAASRAEQIAAHVRHRENVEAAYQAAADRDAWAEAVPRLRAEWAAHQQKYPERVRASPRT
jgi:hypothetical protein